MSTRIDYATLDRHATESMRARLANLTVADLDRPSGCSGWDIRNLLSHLVGGNIRFAQALRGEPADWPTRDAEPVLTPLAEFDTSAAELASAAAGLDDPRRIVHLAAGDPPAFFAVGVHGADMLVHAWDLAVATGQDRTLDPALCEAAMAVIERYPSSFWGPGQFFAPRIQIDSTEPQDRLLAFSGRDPNR
jgi:uncharacterized protein (TIGR03086 family)